MKRIIFNIIAITPIIVLLYLAFAESHYNGLSIEITSPRDNVTVYAPLILVSGIVSDATAKVTINNTPVVVAENGYFIISVDLVKGKNTITTVAEVKGVGKVNRAISVIYSQ
jgi:hypothetical protein